VCVICWTYYVLRHWVFFLSFFEIFSRLLRQYTTIKREQQSTTKTNNNNNTHTTIKRMGIFLYFGTCGVLRMWWLLYCFLYDFQLLLRQYTTTKNNHQHRMQQSNRYNNQRHKHLACDNQQFHTTTTAMSNVTMVWCCVVWWPAWSGLRSTRHETKSNMQTKLE
jgi:hypothetical protein